MLKLTITRRNGEPIQLLVDETCDIEVSTTDSDVPALGLRLLAFTPARFFIHGVPGGTLHAETIAQGHIAADGINHLRVRRNDEHDTPSD